MGLALQVEAPERSEALSPETAAEVHSEAAGEVTAVPESVLRDPETASDADIVLACLLGEPHYFGILVQRYTGMLISFARSRLGSGDIAEEVAQETMVRAYEQLLRLKVPRSFSNWLLGIANHVIIKIAAQRGRTLPLADASPDGEGVVSASVLRGGAAEDERWSAIVEQVNSLPARYRIIVVLKHLEGLSCRDIGERLGLPLGTVTGRLSRGYAMLRGRLIGGGGQE